MIAAWHGSMQMVSIAGELVNEVGDGQMAVVTGNYIFRQVWLLLNKSETPTESPLLYEYVSLNVRTSTDDEITIVTKASLFSSS